MWRMVVMLIVSLIFVLAINRKIVPLFSIFASSPKETILDSKLIDLDGDGKVEKIIKTKKENLISISLYELLEDKGTITPELTSQYNIPSREDGFVYYKTTITGLTFSDVNSDGQLDIIVSFFDKHTRQSSLCTLLWNKKQKTLRRLDKEYEHELR